jgi:phosphate uptake regulator
VAYRIFTIVLAESLEASGLFFMASHPPKEKRKVQISGKSSCMISLPKRWVKEMGLVQGRPLTISRHNSTSLLISMDKSLGTSVVQGVNDVGALFISRPEPPETILRKIVCLYVQGYNMIKVRLAENSSNTFLKSTIREMVRRQLIGVEIVSDTSDGLVLQILLGKSELTIDNAMKRMSIVSSSMLEEAISALRYSDKRRARDVMEKDEIERFGSYTSRQILGSINHDFFKEGDDSEPEKLAIYLMISREIESVAKCARDVARHALRLEAPLDGSSSESLGKLGSLTAEILDSAVLSFFKRDSRAVEITIDRSKEFWCLEEVTQENFRHLLDSSFGVEQIVAVVSALESMKDVISHSVEISNQVLNLTSDQYARAEDAISSPLSRGELVLERDPINVYT